MMQDMVGDRGVDELVPAELLRALAARLCHDLAGPLGVLSGGIEAALDDPTDPAEALELARQASVEAAARLRLLRAAWAGTEEALSVADITRLADGLPRRHAIRPDLSALGATTLPPAEAVLLLNLLLLAAEALPAGGDIAVARDREQDWVLRVSGPRARWPAGFATGLSEGPIEARGLAVPMTLRAAAAAGMSLSLLMGGPEDAPPLLVRAR